MKSPSQRLTDIEVEPLSDLAWQRIEKNLMGALERAEQAPTALHVQPPRRGALRWAMAGGVAAAAAVVTFVALSSRDPAAPGFRGTSRIVTAETPSAVSLGDVTLTVAPSSAVLVDDQRAGGVLIVLERGSVECEVAPRGSRPPLTVQAGDVRVEVLGTRFAVSREGDDAKVVVYEGVVTVAAPGELTRVSAGQHWPRQTADESAREGGEPRVRTGRRDHRRRDREPAPASDRSAAPSDKERYETAARLEASDPDAARVIYRQLTASQGAWAANALYALARLELDLGNDDRARALLEDYQERFPGGQNRADARALLDQLTR